MKNNIKESFELVLIGQDIDKLINKYPSIEYVNSLAIQKVKNFTKHYFDSDILSLHQQSKMKVLGLF